MLEDEGALEADGGGDDLNDDESTEDDSQANEAVDEPAVSFVDSVRTASGGDVGSGSSDQTKHENGANEKEGNVEKTELIKDASNRGADGYAVLNGVNFRKEVTGFHGSILSGLV